MHVRSKYFGSHEITEAIDTIEEEGRELKQKSMASVLFRRYQHEASGASGQLSGSVRCGKPLGAEDAERFVFYEKLFLLVDNDSNGYLSKSQTQGLLSFIAVDTSRSKVDQIFNQFDSDGNGVITQEEFIELCAQLLWPLPLSLLKMATDNFVACSANRAERNRAYCMRGELRTSADCAQSADHAFEPVVNRGVGRNPD